MKDHVVLAIEKENLSIRRAQLAAQSFCKLNGGKSAADDDDSHWLYLLDSISPEKR
jgi:hypothetical protein